MKKIKEIQSFTDLLSNPEITEEIEIRSSFGICAIHGGGLERATEAVVSHSMVSSSSADIPNLHQELKVTNGLSVAIKNLESFKQNYKKGSELHNRVTKQLKSLKS